MRHSPAPEQVADTLKAAARLYAEGKYAEALTLSKSLLDIQSATADALNIAAASSRHLGDLKAAEDYWNKTVRVKPDHADAHNNLGNLLLELHRFTEAEAAYRQALSIQPDYAEAHFNLGNLCRILKRDTEAEAAYLRAIDTCPDYADAHCNLGVLYLDLKRFAEAEIAFRATIECKPDHGHALGKYDFIRRYFCAWRDLPEHERTIAHLIDTGQMTGLAPFDILAIPRLTARQQRQASMSFAAMTYCALPLQKQMHKTMPAPKRSLRIGYLSADFYEHATARLLAGVIEHHDKAKISVFGYTYGTDRSDPARRRIIAACEVFRNLEPLSDLAAAQQIAADEVDILVDLKGYTAEARPGITALRPAPVIVNWLGYPGTLGHPRLADYIIGDPIVTPLEHAAHFSETLALMPHCYQPNDNSRPIGRKPTRLEAGLPESGFVFGCFNQNYKFNPEIFSLWCRLLEAVPDSVLWLLKSREAQAIENLLNEAAARQVPPERIIFAPALPPTEHLGRIQLIDLALDTYPITSHTTASDALWAGVPLVTRQGETFVSRVAASLLNAVGLPELITTSNEDYFKLALSLAQDAARLAAIREQLRTNRLARPLFNTELFTRDLERLLAEIWAKHTQGSKTPFALNPSQSPNKNDPAAMTPDTSSQNQLRLPFDGCPLCGCKDETRHKTTDARAYPYFNSLLPTDFNWVRCKRCGHIHTEYFWTDAGLQVLLKTAHPHQVAGNLDAEAMRSVWAPIVQRVISQLNHGLPGVPEQLTWLDAGCGNGALVMTAAEYGFNAIGLDLRPEAVNALTERGYRCYKGNLSTINVDQPVHVLSLMDLLEHLPNPIHILQRARELLRPDGLLLISCPNMNSLSWREMDRHKANPYWFELEHCHNFSRESLIALLRRSGFEAIHYDISARYKAGMDIICKHAS
ncbi:MAG: methyltransferase domain-containing protein [Gallionella sp.]|nr:methyltransferase domain-containing protein [Gallionella sp.]